MSRKNNKAAKKVMKQRTMEKENQILAKNAEKAARRKAHQALLKGGQQPSTGATPASSPPQHLRSPAT